MVYPYMTLWDGTQISHTQLLDGNHVRVHFERATETAYCFATCELPAYTWQNVEGFSEKDLAFLTEFAEHNAHLFYRYAQCGGVQYA